MSYFIFDDIASLAGSADAQNVDPEILKEICEGLKNENPYCADHHFIGVEARACAEGITVIPENPELEYGCSVFYNPCVALRVLGEEGSLTNSKNYDDLTRDSYNRCRCTHPM